MRVSLLIAASAVAVCFAAPTQVTAFGKAGISPIVESSVPANASPETDKCTNARMNSCDNCATEAGEYCHFRANGAARCCKVANNEAKVSVKAQEEDDESNGAQVWHAFSTFLSGVFGGEQQSSAGSVSPMTQEADAESGAVGVEKQEAQPESAAVGVVKTEAEAESGAVGVIRSEAEPESAAVGVVQSEAEPESAAVSPIQAEAEPESAAVSPIKENPIPAEASSSDVCTMKRSCDVCSEEQYCRYSHSGKASCCVLSGAAKMAGKASASVMPSTSLASAESGAVGVTRSEAEPESAKVSPVQAEAEPESAKVSPITESPIPAWASSSDVCLEMPSCDACGVASYCRYSSTGKASCCGRMIALK